MAVRALVFDVFGTLVDWRSGVAEAFRESGAPDDAEELADAWRARYGPILAEVNDGARPWGGLDELHLATLDDLLAERGLELSEAARASSWRPASLDPGRTSARASRRCAASARWRCSPNAHVAMLVDLARHGDLRFDAASPPSWRRRTSRRRRPTAPPPACSACGPSS